MMSGIDRSANPAANAKTTKYTPSDPVPTGRGTIRLRINRRVKKPAKPPSIGRRVPVSLTRAGPTSARSGDCIAISAYLGQSDSFDRAMVSFAEAYADQNEQDYAAFQKAVKDKRIAAVAGI